MRGAPRPADLEQRIERLAARAAEGLDLFGTQEIDR